MRIFCESCPVTGAILIREGEKSMISNQILQNTIDGLKGITRVDMCIIDTEGKVLATTFPANFSDFAL